MTAELTTKSYWEQYYSRSNINKEHIVRICSQYDRFWDLVVEFCDFQPRNVIEIGAYPGRYIAYVAARYGLEATALDYNSDRNKIEEAFQSMGIDSYEIVQEDFLLFKPTKQNDIVVSIGFIEHFENFDEVLDKHARLLAPGGSMLIMIPNKRYLRKFYGLLCDYQNLKAHNLKCMDLKVFRKFSRRNGLQTVHLGYWGGFPYSVHQELNFVQKFLYKTTRFVFKRVNPLIEAYPNRFLSSTIIGIFHKPLNFGDI